MYYKSHNYIRFGRDCKTKLVAADTAKDFTTCTVVRWRWCSRLGVLNTCEPWIAIVQVYILPADVGNDILLGTYSWAT